MGSRWIEEAGSRGVSARSCPKGRRSGEDQLVLGRGSGRDDEARSWARLAGTCTGRCRSGEEWSGHGSRGGGDGGWRRNRGGDEGGRMGKDERRLYCYTYLWIHGCGLRLKAAGEAGGDGEQDAEVGLAAESPHLQELLSNGKETTTKPRTTRVGGLPSPVHCGEDARGRGGGCPGGVAVEEP